MTTTGNLRQTIKGNYFQPAFLICVGFLAITASGMSIAVKLSGIYLTKEPLPPKKPLSQMDTSLLAHYKVVGKQNIENMDVLNTLGTEEYIQWNLEDTSAPIESDARFCTLFVTYYGISDKVPHVPDECYIGGGYQKISSETVTLQINKNGGKRQIGARCLVFSGTGSDIWTSEDSHPVYYTFSVNGEYAAGREDTRLILNRNLFSKFSYFSKVEWKFYNQRFGRMTYPNKDEASAASENLLAVILPILEQEHWPSGLW